jgi:hypothetical protein
MDIQHADTHSSSAAKRTTFNVEQFKRLFQTFNSNTLIELPSLYAPEIVFKDPIHQLQGLTALRTYFKGFLNPAMQCKFEFTHQLLGQNEAFLQWQMHYQHTQLAGGKLLQLSGSTFIRFGNQIFYHEDYYDMGAMIYQHIPVIGWAVKKINTHLTAEKSEQKT